MIANMLIRAISEATIGICKQQFRPVIKPMGYGRGHGMPKSFNDIWFSPTIDCTLMIRNRGSAATTDSTCSPSYPLWWGVPSCWKAMGCFFRKSQRHTKLTSAVGRRVPQVVLRMLQAQGSSQPGLLQYENGDILMVELSHNGLQPSRAQCGMLNTVTASHKSQHITGENIQPDNCMVLSGYLSINLKWSYRSRVRRGVRLCWKKQHII